MYVYILKKHAPPMLHEKKREKHSKCVDQMKRSWDSGLTVYLG